MCTILTGVGSFVILQMCIMISFSLKIYLIFNFVESYTLKFRKIKNFLRNNFTIISYFLQNGKLFALNFCLVRVLLNDKRDKKVII